MWKSQREIRDPAGCKQGNATGTIKVQMLNGAAPNCATDIYGDANDNKTLFNVTSQPVIAHWLEWFGCPDSCNYPSVFCQAGRGLNLPQLDWLMSPCSFTHSLRKCFFVKAKKARGSSFSCRSRHVNGSISHLRSFFSCLYILLGKVGPVRVWTDLFVHSFSTQVHVQILQWLRATNVLGGGQTFKR